MITPERGFMKNLKALDKRLNCVFRPEHEHFVITYQRNYGEPVNLHCVKADDGGFRQPDMRDLKVIYDGDMTNKNAKEELAKRAYEMRQYDERQREKSRDNLKHMTRLDKRQLMSAFNQAHGSGKKNATFRKIDYKPKGEVFK